MSEQLLEKDCPDPGVHGNPFRYCPYCTWTERMTMEAASFVSTPETNAYMDGWNTAQVEIDMLRAERDRLMTVIDDAVTKLKRGLSDSAILRWEKFNVSQAREILAILSEVA